MVNAIDWWMQKFSKGHFSNELTMWDYPLWGDKIWLVYACLWNTHCLFKSRCEFPKLMLMKDFKCFQGFGSTIHIHFIYWKLINLLRNYLQLSLYTLTYAYGYIYIYVFGYSPNKLSSSRTRKCATVECFRSTLIWSASSLESSARITCLLLRFSFYVCLFWKIIVSCAIFIIIIITLSLIFFRPPN